MMTKIENSKKQYPFLIEKEKNIDYLKERTNRLKNLNNSLNTFNKSKTNSYINHNSNIKHNNIELTSEKTNRSSSMKQGVKFNKGRWTKEEHDKFLKGIIEYGNDWKMVQKIIKTRSRSQARSHAQKYFIKVKKKIISKNKEFNGKNLLNYVFNSIIKFKALDVLLLHEVYPKYLLQVLLPIQVSLMCPEHICSCCS